MAYSPKYVDLAEVPYTGSDVWTDAEKLAAVKKAEAIFEAHVNDGDPIAAAQRESIHGDAVNARATLVLFYGPDAPEDVRGDVLAESDDEMSARAFVQREYDELKKAILAAQGDESDDASNERVGFGTF